VHAADLHDKLAVFCPEKAAPSPVLNAPIATEGWPGWVGLCGWLPSEMVYLPEDSHPFHY